MDRRLFLGGSTAAVLYAAGARQLLAGEPEPVPFSRSTVINRARSLASAPFAWPDPPLPDSLKTLGYSEYQGIRFREDKRLFSDPASKFNVDLFHSGFIFNVPVEIFLVEDGKSTKLAYNPDLFTFQLSPPPDPGTPLEFAGLRVRSPINSPSVMDEFLVFAGASYFRAVAKGQIYGLSARGLAIGTASKKGEEFPFFRAFWIERPSEDRLVIHALLDGPSVSGAYRFSVRPGDSTQIDVEASLFARVDVSDLGLAPLTSMFLYDAKDRAGHDDFRPSIHDSDGLAIWNGSGERLWRPLHNPSLLQMSAFADSGPRGFGLIQRERRFSEHEDLEALYHKRPSLWIEPIGDWGDGAVVLVEIPTEEEIHDNIVAFWRPKQPIAAGGEAVFTYRLTWGWDAPAPSGRMPIVRTLSGAASGDRRRFVVDYAYAGAVAPSVADLQAKPHVSGGSVHNVILMENPEIPGVRVSFELDPEGRDLVELRLDLVRGSDPMAEVWVYRWTA